MTTNNGTFTKEYQIEMTQDQRNHVGKSFLAAIQFELLQGNNCHLVVKNSGGQYGSDIAYIADLFVNGKHYRTTAYGVRWAAKFSTDFI